MKKLAPLLLLLLPFQAWGAFPTIAASITTEESTNPTSHTVNLPTGIVSGNLLVVSSVCDGAGTITWPGTFTQITNAVSASAQPVRLASSYRFADGSEGSTITVTTSLGVKCVSKAWRITGAHASTAPEGASVAAASTNSDDPDPPSLTPTGAAAKDFLWLVVVGIDQGDRSVLTYPTSYGNTWIENNEGFSSSGDTLAGADRNLNAATENPSVMQLNISEQWVVSTIAIFPATSALTFDAAPAISARSTNSITVSYTVHSPCTSCTIYGVAAPDGASAPSCDAIEAQTVTSGYKYFADSSTTPGTPDSSSFGTYTDGTVRDGFFCIEDGGGSDSAVVPLADMYKIPAFSSAPTVSAQDDNDYTVAKTLDGAGSVFAVACLRGSAAATVAQVEAGQCTGSVAALAAQTDDATGTMVLGGALARPIHDLYVVGTYGSQHEAAVHALAGEMLDPPAGKQYVKLTSLDSSSYCASFNTTQSPTIAVNDIFRIDLFSTPSSFLLAMFDDCRMTLLTNGSQQRVDYSIYDDSAGAYMAGGIAGVGKLWFNNSKPNHPDPGATVFYVPVGSAMNPFDLSPLCLDPDGDAVVITTVGVWPVGLSIVGNILQGTATIRAISRGLTLRCTDGPGDSVDWQ